MTLEKDLTRIKSPFMWGTDEFMEGLNKAPLENLELELRLARDAEKLSYTQAQNTRYDTLISKEFQVPVSTKDDFEYIAEAKRVEKLIAEDYGYGSQAYRTAVAQRSGRILKMKMKERFRG